MSQAVLEGRGLRKAHGDSVAVDGVDITVEKGKILGLLGPNGAGKTSTLEGVEGIRPADGGSGSVLGVAPGGDHRKLYDLIWVQLQTPGLPPALRVGEATERSCAYHEVERLFDPVDRLGLKEQRHS